ncbi:MAG: DISARM system SNF2-like helicase DrmD [Vicinamibacterales bacterium]|nr:DISARM system SNF2-like helicase DrmD [Vicinamibacterales bacterium]
MAPVATDLPPTPGEIVRVRSRRYLVEGVTPAPAPEDQTLVRLSCLEDDAEGEELEVLWEREVDAQRVSEADWSRLAQGQFDLPRHFAAYYRTLRWNTVTSTDPKLFQAPYRAGIRIDAYQLEPLRKALLLPRVNLFIADDVGLGKTIEAGLIVRELLMRQRVRRIVVAAPPSVLLQWKEELDQRFGLTFVVLDRDYVRRMRQERGFSVNPWATHSRFIVSHHLLRDEDDASPLRDWLGTFAPQSLLILDEAHNAAPASGARYAVDSQFTKSIRELAPLFEHRLFLSATPHNGHSNSFSALLEILDPQRFCRGVPVESAKQLDAVMVRRLKEDLRRLEGGFPDRKIEEVAIDGLPADDPALLLPELLDEYREAREERLKDAPKSVQNAAGLVLCSLQKRLLSSVEAFACTLRVHRRAFEAAAAKAAPAPSGPVPASLKLLATTPDADDDRADASEEDVAEQEEAAMEAATARGMTGTSADAYARERDLLARMTDVADAARGRADARVKHLVDWCKANPHSRVLVFTEYGDTKRYLERQLRAALTPGQEADPRIATFHGGMGDEAREEVKRAFNTDPAKHPLRVLIATDAAREGVNLQNHCADLFHFDVPWNPSRLEQRNGRIDRKLQRAPEVRCRYFVYAQRPEDRVLKALVEKTKVIRRQLGSLAPVLERKLEDRLSAGFARRDAASLVQAIEHEQVDAGQERATAQELEATRQRDHELMAQISELGTLLGKSREWLRLEEPDLRQAISCGLELMGVEPLQPGGQDGEYALPDLTSRLQANPSWMYTLDTLRAPQRKGQQTWEWRRQQPVRPVVFQDQGTLDAHAVHLHLEHRFVQRLLGRFRSQGFTLHDLSRACIGVSDDPVARVILLGRLSLYGERASRLHDEILAVAARWTDGAIRKEPLKPYAGETLDKTIGLLERTLSRSAPHDLPPQVVQRLASGAVRDLDELRPHLKAQAGELTATATKQLTSRGDKEAAEMRAILDAQRARIRKTQEGKEKQADQLPLFAESERRQIEADTRYWQKRLDELGGELDTEPERIRRSYDVKATRFEPVGLVYLWPITG